ncbi:MAG: hydrogenase nickel incorporation protein HypB [Proteobacteria bacterium]|nr:hydrogenase nickel incorporation protein HypB [Desulfobulbaceae bacterium]MBU4151500.1 hydrogenase nickel incorporation protein HypB [Pseudomonadota bacterium]MDP2106664.1 hydrogenase nickel incorporation protein HypB [Desulfobulbaceae bacterium]
MCDSCHCNGNHDHQNVTIHHRSSHSHNHSQTEKTIRVERDVLDKNNTLGAANRAFFARQQILALNLVSSPGSGKTSILERTIRDVGRELTISVIEGDQQTVRDAERIQATGAEAIQVNTGTGCHLDAHMIQSALPQLKPTPHSLLFIENVGNLVCPALFDLGEAAKVVIISVTEGEDKPLKYPHMFRAASICVINKIDLLPYLDFDLALCKELARQVNPELIFFEVSAKNGDGFDNWYHWLRQEFLLINTVENS